MDSSPIEMLRALCISAFCGLCVSFVYDIFSIIIFEILSRKSRAIDFILDVLFIFTFTIVFILLLYYLCDGKMRGMFFWTMLLGALIYCRMIRKTVNRMLRLLIFPIKIFIGFLVNTIKKMVKFLSQAIAKKRIKLYNKDVK